MGGAITSLPGQVKASLARQLREEYEMLIALGSSDNDIKDRLTEKYTKLLRLDQPKDSRDSKDPVTPNSTPTIQSSPSAVSSRKSPLPNGRAKGKGSTPTRRRSFGSFNHQKALPTTVEDPIAEAARQSVTLLETSKSAEIIISPTNADNWDSVRDQPYCNICKMAFKNQGFLERHSKFSDLHLANLKKLETGDFQSTTADVEPSVIPVSLPVQSANTQEEGVDYKLMYSGSKFFWRTQESVDLNLYHHLATNCIEVIPYDISKSSEMPRIYLSHSLIKKHIGTEVQQKMNNMRHDIASSHAPHSNYGENIEVDAIRICMTTHIIARLIKNLDENIRFNLQSSDNSDETPLLNSPPIGLVPVNITRRRRTNSEEIEHTLTDLANDRQELAAATAKAARIADLVHRTVDTFTVKKWYDHFGYWRKKWIWAIHRVILQKRVKEMDLFLKSLEKKANAKSSRGSKNYS